MKRYDITMNAVGYKRREAGGTLRGKRFLHEESDPMQRGGRGGHRRGAGGRRGGRTGSGAQTFRRGRAIEFYKTLQAKEETLLQQLEAKEFASIQQLIATELKVVQTIKSEFQATFGINEEDLKPEIISEHEEISNK